METRKIHKKVSQLLMDVRKVVPLVHNITNYVTVNDCANALLAIGGSPIMADDRREAADITKISSALVINLGTLNERTVESMLLSGKQANALKIPVILDPVGAGASEFRNETTRKILKEVKITILRGNLSEISFVSGLTATTKGVDVSEKDKDRDAAQIALTVARQLDSVVAVTGAVDVITDGKRMVKVHNGHEMLSKVTGTGCMTSAIIGAYAGAVYNDRCGSYDYVTAAVAGIASMGIAGELAYERAGATGTGSFHIAILDALSNLDEKVIMERAKVDEE